MTDTTKIVRRETALDEVDLAMLRILRHDGRIANSALAEAVGIAPSTCHVRLRSLVDDGVITEFAVSVDQRSLGLTLQAMIGVTLAPVPGRRTSCGSRRRCGSCRRCCRCSSWVASTTS